MTERVQGVVTRQGTDISETCNRLGEAYGFPPRVLVACALGESDLDEHASRFGTWPDVSFGLCQQTVAYAPMGDQTGSVANISVVRAALLDVVTALETAAPQLARFWQQSQDGPETLGRYNWPARGLAGNPNANNIARAWAASAQYLEAAPVTDLAERWIAAMHALTGTPYVFGGKDVRRDGGLDCSGLLTSTARAVGLALGVPDLTNADGLKAYCEPVAASAVRPGDLVLFSQTYGVAGPDSATHVGVWLGPGRMLDTHDGVHETDFSTPYWQQHLMGFWRPRGLAGGGEHGGDDMARVQELETIISEMQRVAREDVLPNLDKALGYKLPKAAREALATGAKPAAQTIARAGAEA